MFRPVAKTRNGESRPLALACVEGSIVRAELAAACLREIIATATATATATAAEDDASWARRRLYWVECALACSVERRRALREEAPAGAG
jgi:hypothetical protein